MKINSLSENSRNISKEFDIWFEKNMTRMEEPYMYFGDEPNSFKKEWINPEKTLKIAIGSGTRFGYCTGQSIFYEQFNTVHPEWITERVGLHASSSDRQLLKEAGFPVLSSESHMPLKAYDVVAISNDTVSGYVNMIAYFLLSGIAPKWKDRTEEDPIFIHGGHANMNLSPIKDICDIYVIGEGEEIDVFVLEEIEQQLKKETPKEEILLGLAKKWDCLWIPRFYEERFDSEGKLLGMFPIVEGIPNRIKRAYVKDLDHTFIVSKQIIPFNAFETGNKCRLEISRGCDSKCAFCGGGFTYLPYRMRSKEVYLKAVDDWIFNCGLRRAILTVGFSSAAHPQYYEIVNELGKKGYPVDVVPVRVTDYIESPDTSSEVRKGRLVIGIEGNSQRLRDLVSKHATEEDILKTVSLAMDRGYTSVKFYMIAELPTETEKDTMEILELGKKLRSLIDKKVEEGCDPLKVFFSWNLLRTMPFTPFQWWKSPLKVSETLNKAIEGLNELGFITKDFERIKADDEHIYEALIELADSRVEDLLIDIAKHDLLSLWKMPEGIIDLANEYFDSKKTIGWDTWFSGHDITDVLPWDFIDGGVSKDYLKERYTQILSGDMKQAHRCMEKCDGCGQCDESDFKHFALWRSKIKPTEEEILQQPVVEYTRKLLFVFEVKSPYNLIDPTYWECDFTRAMTRSQIKYDPFSVRVTGGQYVRDDKSLGIRTMEVNVLSDGMELEEIKERINNEAVHFNISRVEEVNAGQFLKFSFTYKYPLSETEEEIAKANVAGITEKLKAGEPWVIDNKIMITQRAPKTVETDVSSCIKHLWIEDGALWFEVVDDEKGHLAPSRSIVCAITGHDPMENEEGNIYRQSFEVVE